MTEPMLRLQKYHDSLVACKIGDIYKERKERGDDTLPMLTVSIHSGVSDGELEEDELGKRVTRSEDKAKYKRAESDDVVFNMMRAWQGAIGVVRTTGMVSPAYIVATPNDKVYPLFMDYYLKTPHMINTINRLSYGLMDFRKRLYWDSFITIDCLLPSIDEQKDIVQVMESVEEMISCVKEGIRLWEEKKKGVMQVLFSPKNLSKCDDVDKNPSDFVKLKDVCSYSTKPLTNSDVKINGRYPVYDANSMIGYTDIPAQTVDYISIIKDGAGAGRVKKLPADSSCLGTMGMITANDGADLTYLYYLLQTIDFSQYSVGSTIPHVYFKDYGCASVFMPAKSEQLKIAKTLSMMDEVISLKQQKLEIWQNIKKGLLQQMFV